MFIEQQMLVVVGALARAGFHRFRKELISNLSKFACKLLSVYRSRRANPQSFAVRKMADAISVFTPFLTVAVLGPTSASMALSARLFLAAGVATFAVDTSHCEQQRG